MSEEKELPILTTSSDKPDPSLLDRLSESPYPAWVTSATIFSTSMLSRYYKLNIKGLPPLYSNLAFSGIYAFAGYTVSQGDVFNSTGIATAWSLAYLLHNTSRTLKTRHIVPIANLSLVMVQGTIYGQRFYREYFGLE